MTRQTELAVATLYFFNREVFQTWTLDVYEAEIQTEETGFLPDDWESTYYRAWDEIDRPDFIDSVLEELYTDVQSLGKILWDFNDTIRERA